MAKFIPFFPRQMVMGAPSGSGTVYSDIVDASMIAQVTSELRVYVATSTTTTTCSVTLQQSDDQTFADSGWSTYGTVSVTGTGTQTGTVSTVPKRFLRAKLDLNQQNFAMIQFTSRGFC